MPDLERLVHTQICSGVLGGHFSGVVCSRRRIRRNVQARRRKVQAKVCNNNSELLLQFETYGGKWMMKLDVTEDMRQPEII
jgi:hypothetical protein